VAEAAAIGRLRWGNVSAAEHGAEEGGGKGVAAARGLGKKRYPPISLWEGLRCCTRAQTSIQEGVRAI
jgi:hypothetical protein